LYMGIARCHRADEMAIHRKMKTKSEVVRQTFLDHGVTIEDMTRDYDNLVIPVICVNLIGRVLWMNNVFQDSFQKGENDLLEIFVPLYGFDAYDKGLEIVLKECPKQHRVKDLIFERFDGVNGHPMAYVVTFYSLDMDLSNRSKRQQADVVLSRIGHSTESLDRIYGTNQSMIAIMGLDGTLLYMNEYFRVHGIKTDEHLMTSFLKYIKDWNQHLVDIFDIVFRKERPKEYIYVTEVFMAGPSIAKKFKIIDVRIEFT
jgi:hypothetical protein